MNKMLHTLAAVVLSATAAYGYVNQTLPKGGIEYDAVAAAQLHGQAEAFDPQNPTHLRTVVPGIFDYWFAGQQDIVITELRGYAHIGETGLSQSDANARIALIQLWSWVDSNGNGIADLQDAADYTRPTTRWQLVHELRPADGQGNVVGWETDTLSEQTSSWQGDLLQGSGNTITVPRGTSMLFLIRVVDVNGNTNLMDAPGGLELWDDGDTSNGIGSDVPADKFVDYAGNTPGQADGRLPAHAVVRVYNPR